jgi:hypothetical protein
VALLEPGPSPIHGTGCFATAWIRAGDQLGEFAGDPVDQDGPHVLWASFDGGTTWRGRRGTGVLRFLNHCDQPNAQFDGFDLLALQDIAPGAEVTIDYGPG